MTAVAQQSQPIDPWVVIERGLAPERVGVTEALFALSNGWLGVRGSVEQQHPHHLPGALINGFFEIWPIIYPEMAYGYATVGQTIVFVPDATVMEVAIDGELLELTGAEVERRLELRTGRLTTTARWPQGVLVKWQRLVSLTHRNLLALRVEVQADKPCHLQIVSRLVNRQDADYLNPTSPEFDPRRAKTFGRRVLEPVKFDVHGNSLWAEYRTLLSTKTLEVSVEHVADGRLVGEVEGHADRAKVRFETSLGPGEQVGVTKFVTYQVNNDPDQTGDLLAGVRDQTFEDLTDAQQAWLDSFWNRADVVIEGDEELQQAARWAIFQMGQASAQVQRTSIPAKGLTGQAYDGHYFWDGDIFMMPFLAYTGSPAAREMIAFRYATLPDARQRAFELSQRGALYPWRTINGVEASAYYAAGTAQYHINADVIYGLHRYLLATGDEEALWDWGVEMAVETARLWVDLGFFREGSFHIYGVTGPDEYNAVVDDNAYTNLMARMNLRFAVESVEKMRMKQPARFAQLAERLELAESEPADWRRAAGAMYVPHDPVLGITPQDQQFLSREPWEWSTPADRYPLLLNFHPLVIYRHQVLKQPDVVMAAFLLGDEFTDEQKRADFAFYDPLTTGDSSLSFPVQAIVAAGVGDTLLALDYFQRNCYLDLRDVAHNTADGVHLACAAGVWLAAVFGFGGFTHAGEVPAFDPRLPPTWHKLGFTLTIKGSHLSVEITRDRIHFSVEGEPIKVWVRGEAVKVAPDREGAVRL
jgi:alpha,alpha-trehalose phosphorylase